MLLFLHHTETILTFAYHYFSDAGSDGNFDSYLQGLPKSSKLDFVNITILTIIFILMVIGVSTYTYMRLHLKKKFNQVGD